MSGSEPVGVGLWELVTHRASASPDRVMWVDERGRSFTAPRFLDAAECTAAALAERGVGSGTRVSWQLPNVMEAPVLLAALARLEAVQNPIIPQLRHNELGFILEETEAELLVVPESWRGFDFAAMGRDVAAGTRCEVLALDLDAAAPDQLALPHARRDVLAAHVPTAGSEQQVRWAVSYTL
jgi:cyclohexanecarboxylate-CoA ligase